MSPNSAEHLKVLEQVCSRPRLCFVSHGTHTWENKHLLNVVKHFCETQTFDKISINTTVYHLYETDVHERISRFEDGVDINFQTFD